MLEKSGNGSSSNVINISKNQNKRLPTLKELAVDPDIRAFLKIVHEEDLREEAVKLLERAIAKATESPSRPLNTTAL